MFNKHFSTSTKLIFLLIVTIAVAACGGGEPPAPPSVDLSFQGSDDFKFTPADATVEAGATVNVTFENTGVLEHSWVLVSDRVNVEDATEEDALGGASTGIIATGETSTISFTAPPAGNYQIVCAVPGHATGGMVGTFTVTEGN
ncbi:MAG: plastocyanin/azurin family copper-binding protein [Chloroflexota bacterium]